MRVCVPIVVSRCFQPGPVAASFRLGRVHGLGQLRQTTDQRVQAQVRVAQMVECATPLHRGYCCNCSFCGPFAVHV